MSKSGQTAYRAEFEPMNLTPEERAFVNQPRRAEERPDDYDPLIPALMSAASWAKEKNQFSIHVVLEAILDHYDDPKMMADIAMAAERATRRECPF